MECICYLYTDYFIDFKFTFLLKFGGLRTFKQLEQGYEIEKLHVFVGSKLLKKCFHRDSM